MHKYLNNQVHNDGPSQIQIVPNDGLHLWKVSSDLVISSAFAEEPILWNKARGTCWHSWHGILQAGEPDQKTEFLNWGWKNTELRHKFNIVLQDIWGASDYYINGYNFSLNKYM